MEWRKRKLLNTGYNKMSISWWETIARICAVDYKLKNVNLYFIHSFNFYSTSSSPLLLWGAPDTARIPCRCFTPKRHRQTQVKDLPKVRTWWLEQDSKPRPFRRRVTNLSDVCSVSAIDWWNPPKNSFSNLTLFGGTGVGLRFWVVPLAEVLYKCLQWMNEPDFGTWRLEWDSNPQPFGRKAPNLSTSHHAPVYVLIETLMHVLCQLLTNGTRIWPISLYGNQSSRASAWSCQSRRQGLCYQAAKSTTTSTE